MDILVSRAGKNKANFEILRALGDLCGYESVLKNKAKSERGDCSLGGWAKNEIWAGKFPIPGVLWYAERKRLPQKPVLED